MFFIVECLSLKRKGITMQSVDLSDVGSALVIMSGFLVVAISIVVLVIWGVYKFFYDKEEEEIKKKFAAERDKKLPP